MEWREAERRLAAADLGSPAATAAADDVRRLREEYRITHGGLSDKTSS